MKAWLPNKPSVDTHDLMRKCDTYKPIFSKSLDMSGVGAGEGKGACDLMLMWSHTEGLLWLGYVSCGWRTRKN